MTPSSPVRIISPLDGDGDLIVVQESQARIHEGQRFSASYKSPDASPIADNNSLDFLLVVGSLQADVTIITNCGQAYEMLFYEAPTITNNGTQVAAVNRNRNFAVSKKAKMRVYHTPTVGAVGTQLMNVLGAGILGGENRDEDEWDLASSISYLVRITNRAGSAQPMSIQINWYERL